MKQTVTYDVTVHPEDDGSFWAEVTELPGCFASGDDLPELWQALAEAIGLYLSRPGSTAQVEYVEAVETEAGRRDGSSVSAREEFRVLVDA